MFINPIENEAAEERNENVENHPRNKNIWPDFIVEKLIESYHEQEKKMIAGKFPKSHMWQFLAKQLNDEFVMEFTSVQVDNKWKSLVDQYKKKFSGKDKLVVGWRKNGSGLP